MKITAILFGLSLLGVTGAAMLASPAAEAKAGGCIKYGVAGAVAGHYAGHHAIKGALAGCALGIYRRHEYKKEMREREMHDKAAAPPPSH